MCEQKVIELWASVVHLQCLYLIELPKLFQAVELILFSYATYLLG